MTPAKRAKVLKFDGPNGPKVVVAAGAAIYNRGRFAARVQRVQRVQKVQRGRGFAAGCGLLAQAGCVGRL